VKDSQRVQLTAKRTRKAENAGTPSSKAMAWLLGVRFFWYFTVRKPRTAVFYQRTSNQIRSNMGGLSDLREFPKTVVHEADDVWVDLLDRSNNLRDGSYG